MDGFKTSAGSLGGLCGSLSSAIALKGQNITVVLKGYEKVAQTIIDQAVKG
jgi:glycogen synthase